MNIKQIPNHPSALMMVRPDGSKWVKTFMSNTGLGMLYSLDQTQHGDLHHMSISRADRYPDWDDIVQAKEQIMGDIDTMMIIPKRADYVNVHSFCFHVWETPEECNVL